MKAKLTAAAHSMDDFLNNASIRAAFTIVLALVVVLSCFLPYINYPVPVYAGYDAELAYTDAQQEYLLSLQEYEDKLAQRGEVELEISDMRDPAVAAANEVYLAALQNSPENTELIAQSEAALQTAKDELTEARKVLAGIQNLVGPVPAQYPIPASSKLLKYADGLAELALG
jgi:hypothetical protein